MSQGLRELLRVRAGSPVDLAAIDPNGTPGLRHTANGTKRAHGTKQPHGKRAHGKKWGRRELGAIGADLASMQEQLFALAKVGGSAARVLLILQAMDCGGKDGAVKRVAGTMNPQGLHIMSFGKPTPQELAHDFLWRVRRQLPEAGFIGVFNRSHYEDVLIVRVHDLVPAEVWAARYDQINAFEAEITAQGITVIKVMLHISRDEQARRLAERLDDPAKYWKFNPGDLDERALWSDYQEAYGVALSRCSTDIAPWYVVPANRKWYRDWAVATLLRETLDELDLRYPPASFDVDVEKARLKSES